jgi:GxxExxY protein
MNATNADFLHGNLTHRVLGCAYEVHSRLGPGLLESAYKACLLHELSLHRLSYKSEVLVPIRYKEAQLDAGYRADLIVESVVLVELKAVERLLSIHEAQVMTYLRHWPSGWPSHQLQRLITESRHPSACLESTPRYRRRFTKGLLLLTPGLSAFQLLL